MENMKVINLAINRYEVLGMLKEHTNYYQACKNIQKILIIKILQVCPNWSMEKITLNKEQYSTMTIQNLFVIKRFPKIIKEGSRDKYFKNLYLLIVGNEITENINYAECMTFLMYFNYGQSKYIKSLNER